jgi:hypothetical protein
MAHDISGAAGSKDRWAGVVLFPSVPLRASPLTAGSTGIMRGPHGGAAFRYSPAGRLFTAPERSR